MVAPDYIFCWSYLWRSAESDFQDDQAQFSEFITKYVYGFLAKRNAGPTIRSFKEAQWHRHKEFKLIAMNERLHD
ncbi:hypothetical protein OIU76_001779 [Salix suchowensis]|nr:hypothetical protein OIU76_001779 [Salix suchowensis]